MYAVNLISPVLFGSLSMLMIASYATQIMADITINMFIDIINVMLRTGVRGRREEGIPVMPPMAMLSLVFVMPRVTMVRTRTLLA